MSAIFVRKHLNIRNLRKFLLYSLSHDSNLRVTNACLTRVVRQQCLASFAHNYKSVENSSLREKTEASHSKDSHVNGIDFALRDIDFNVRRTGRVNRNEVEKIFSMIVDLGALSTKTHCLYLLRCCGLMRREYPNERVELADKIWKKLHDLGCQFDISHYNAILKVYVDNNHQFLPSDFLTSLESNGIEPNRVTFLHLMQKYCNEGNLTGSSEVLEFMREKELSISESVFSALITGHMNANDVSGAKDIFDAMRSSNLLPSAESYTTLACGYAKKGDIDAVKSVFQDMQNSNVSLSNDNYLSIISSLSTDEHLTFIDEVLELIGEDIYNCRQGVLNTMIDLLNKNLCETAYKLVLALSNLDERSSYSTNIFLQQLVKTKQPIERVMEYCDKISSKGLNNFALVNSAKAAIEYEQFDRAVSLYEIMLQKGIPVRTHNFWPIFTSKNSEKEILATLKSMFGLGVPADFTTFAQFVFPTIDVTNPEDILAKIRDTGHTGIVDPLFIFYCYQGCSDKALYLTRKYPVSLISGFNFEKYITSHSDVSKRDPHSSFHQVLSFILQNIAKFGKDADVIRGTHLANVIELSPSVFETWLKNPEAKGFVSTDRCLDACYNILAKKSPNLLVHLRNLETSLYRRDKLTRKPMTIEEEDRELDHLKKRGLKVDSFLQQQLSFHIREKNIDRANRLLDELEKLEVIYTPFIYSQLFYFHKLQGDVEKTGKTLKALRENHPTFLLDTAQVLEYAMMLIQYSKFEEALDTIGTECKELRINGSKEFLIRTIRRFFDTVVETGDMDLVRNVHSSLVHHSKQKLPARMFFEPLIKMHLFRNDLDGAVQEFKSVAVHNQVTPCVPHLLKKCIVDDDHVKLETVIDSASAVNGKILILHDLMQAFIESGRKDQAVKVLMNLGPKVDGAFLEQMCQRFSSEGKVTELHNFLFTIQDFEYVDRARLFFYLFQLYDHRNEYQKALELYHTIKKEGLFAINDKTSDLLKNLCLRNNATVPSTISAKITENAHPEKSAISRISDASMDEFHDLLEKGDVIQALDNLNSMKKGFIRAVPLYDMTQLIRLVVEKNLVKGLSENVQAMSYIIENVNEITYPLYTHYSEAGDIESMQKLGSFLPDFSLKKSSFNGFMCKAYLASGKEEELLNEMENRYKSKNKIFSAVAFFRILSNPELKDRAVNIAKKYFEDDFDVPIAVLWAHYVINEDYDAGEELEKQFTVQVDKADSIILKAVREKENTRLARMFIDRINKQNVRLRSKGRAYGTLLDLLVLKEKYSDAANLITEANEKSIYLGKHFRSTFVTLKSALERENKPVPFTIPPEESIITAGNFS